jgi:hypothetical protein
MALTDPQSITIGAATIALPRTNSGKDNSSDYTSEDGLVRLNVSHAYNKRTRRVVRIDHAKVASDPFIPTQNAKVSMSCYMVFDVPPVGYTVAETKEVYTGLKGLLTASSDSLVTKVLGGES